MGTVAAPGHTVLVTADTAFIKSSRNGDDGPGCGAPSIFTATAVSATTRWSVDVTYSAGSSGSTRQFTLAAASCGSAFFACPPSSSVATHVVRNVAFHAVDAAATRAIAAVSPLATAARSAATAPFWIVDMARKYARVTSLVLRGKPKLANRSRPRARW